jgi:hypothetical protein
MLKMNFKLNPRNEPFHISTSTKRFPSTNSLQEYWSLYVPSKFMFSSHSNHKCGLGQKKVCLFDCPQQGTGRPEISNRLPKQSVQTARAATPAKEVNPSTSASAGGRRGEYRGPRWREDEEYVRRLDSLPKRAMARSAAQLPGPLRCA